jgi:hypothetical protein
MRALLPKTTRVIRRPSAQDHISVAGYMAGESHIPYREHLVISRRISPDKHSPHHQNLEAYGSSPCGRGEK